MLENQGGGRFVDPVFRASANDAWPIAAADFNQDGLPDIVVGNRGTFADGTSVSVFINNGGGFGAEQEFTASGEGPSDLAVADVDGDGHRDLAIANQGAAAGASVSVLLGDGNGGFGPATTFSGGASAFKLAAGDLDGDDAPDLVAGRGDVSFGGEGLTVLMNDGTGSLSVSDSIDGNMGTAVALADTDGDMDLDVLAGGSTSEQSFVTVFTNPGDGSLGSGSQVPLIEFASSPLYLETPDLDGDSRPDILTQNASARSRDGLLVALNDGSGGFGPATLYSGGQKTMGVAAADVDGDGDRDLLSADNFSLEVTVHDNPGSGQFSKLPRYPAQFGGKQLHLGDIDGDDDLDALSSGIGSGIKHPYIIENQGDGTFADGVEVTVSGRDGGQHGKLRDLNGDQLPDILINSMDSDPPFHFFTALNQGDGTFGSYRTHVVGACGVGEVDAFDLDDDNDRDVVYAERLSCPGVPDSGRRLFISLNNGDGTFESPTVELAAFFANQIAAAHVDNDDHLDLAVTVTDAIAILAGNGDGSFQPAQTFASGGGARDVVAADLNGDGHPDLATANIVGAPNSDEESLSVHLNDGSGGFGDSATYYAPFSEDLGAVNSVEAGDVDADGDLDLLVASSGSNDVTLYENDGSGQFEFRFRYGVGPELGSLAYADVTGNGQKDLAGMIATPTSTGLFALAVVAEQQVILRDGFEAAER